MNLISHARASNICDNFKNMNILVIGDLMLDHWVWGQVSRISPEAPVPVVSVEHYSYTPGGAANVVANLKTLGASVDLVGVVGPDDPGRRLRAMLRRQGIKVDGIFTNGDCPTSLKTRIIADNQQVVRADLELRTEVKQTVWEQLIAYIKEHAAEYNAVILSDYDKGLFWNDNVKEILNVLGKVPVLAGPKPSNIDKFRGTSMITLNASEAKAATGYDAKGQELALAGEGLLKRTGVDEVIITLGARGMSLFKEKQPLVKVPALASQVFDVSGAGDTVLAVISLCKACGIDSSEAMCLASHAAAVVVRKVGTATITSDELLSSLDKANTFGDNCCSRKILSMENAASRIQRLRDSSHPPRIVFTNGCFDVLHVGHLRTLISAKREGDVLVVGLNSDDSVRQLKGPQRPINNENDRAEMLAGMECVDFVVIFPETTPLKLIELIEPDVHVKGGDYSVDDLPEAELLKSFGSKIVLTRLIPGRSTTEIVLKATDTELKH